MTQRLSINNSFKKGECAMAFKLDDIIVDRIQMAYLETTSGDPIGVLTQLSEATLEVSAESTDAVDKNGTLIKRFWRGKTGTFTATNAMLNLNVAALMSGTTKEVASAQNPFQNVPGIAIVKIGETATLNGYVDGSAKVNYLFNNGTMGDTVPTNQYTLVAETGAFTAPAEAPETAVDRVVVRYKRDVTAGVAIHNSAEKFPDTMVVILKVLIVDPCDASQLRAAYVELPSFQPSPETSISFATDGTIDFSGDLQVNYCSSDKEKQASSVRIAMCA